MIEMKNLDQQLSLPARQLRQEIAQQEIKELPKHEQNMIEDGKLTFQKRSTKEQQIRDQKLNQSLKSASNKTFGKDNIPEYTLAPNQHAPLGLYDTRTKKQYKSANHIKVLLQHHDPHCNCQAVGGLFTKAPSNLHKGLAGQELCPVAKA